MVRGRMRVRRKTTKVRSGCATCKIRRIKCDEAKPACLKCTSTGRKCDGYAHCFGSDIHSNSSLTMVANKAASLIEVDALVPLRDVQLPATLPFFGWSIGNRAKRSFHHYIHRSAKDLTGPLPSQIWHASVLRLCASSSAIQHAVVALSEFHERFCSPTTAATSLEACYEHYHQAVRSINRLLTAQDSTSTRLIQETLVACAIFICIEVLVNNDIAALTHLEGGLGIIRHVAKCKTSPGGSAQLDDQMADLAGLFTRLDLQALNFVGSRASQEPVQSSTSFPNLPSFSLYRCIRNAQHFMRSSAKTSKYSLEAPSIVIREREHHLSALELWYQGFKSQCSDLPVAENAANLLIAYHTSRIKLRVCLEPWETAYDTCFADFRAIVAAAECIMASRIPSFLTNSEKYFTLESSIIEPLYFTALKCRDPFLRRQALSLLRRSGKEGVWDGLAMAEIANFVIELEDGNLDIAKQDCELSWADESQRVHSTAVLFNRAARTVDVESSLRNESGAWRFQNAVLKW